MFPGGHSYLRLWAPLCPRNSPNSHTQLQLQTQTEPASCRVTPMEAISQCPAQAATSVAGKLGVQDDVFVQLSASSEINATKWLCSSVCVCVPVYGLQGPFRSLPLLQGRAQRAGESGCEEARGALMVRGREVRASAALGLWRAAFASGNDAEIFKPLSPGAACFLFGLWFPGNTCIPLNSQTVQVSKCPSDSAAHFCNEFPICRVSQQPLHSALPRGQ